MYTEGNSSDRQEPTHTLAAGSKLLDRGFPVFGDFCVTKNIEYYVSLGTTHLIVILFIVRRKMLLPIEYGTMSLLKLMDNSMIDIWHI